MTVRARWFEDLDQEEPEQRGTRIALTGDRPTLQLRLVELVRQEGILYDAGVRCAIKDRPDACCSACSLRDRGKLCAVGSEQERLTTTLAAERERHAGPG